MLRAIIIGLVLEVVVQMTWKDTCDTPGQKSLEGQTEIQAIHDSVAKNILPVFDWKTWVKTGSVEFGISETAKRAVSNPGTDNTQG